MLGNTDPVVWKKTGHLKSSHSTYFFADWFQVNRPFEQHVYFQTALKLQGMMLVTQMRKINQSLNYCQQLFSHILFPASLIFNFSILLSPPPQSLYLCFPLS
jgi:hypothetical protein